MAGTVDINTDAIITATNKLERISNTALPYAVRFTLNDLAFDSKNNVPEAGKELFTTRNRSFLKAATFVNKAKGKSINGMESSMGINSVRFSKIAENLSKQETGGSVERNLIPMKQARISNSDEKKVRRVNHVKNIKLSKSKKRGTGTGFVYIKKSSKGTIFKVKKSARGTKLIPIYHVKKGRRVNLKRRPFISNSAKQPIKDINKTFLKNAEKQIKRLRK